MSTRIEEGSEQTADDRHIIDVLIEERAANLMARPMLWRLLKPTLLPFLGYHEAVTAVNDAASMSGLEIFHYVSDRLRMNVITEGLEHVPEQGGAIIMPNHPAGIADGIAVFDALKHKRDDIILFANRDAIRAAPGLADLIIPVEWVDEKRTHERRKETVKSMVRAFRDERLVVIFPSGRLAQPTLGGLVERPWQPTAMNLALKYEKPVIPMHVGGHNSWVYYLFYFLHEELRDMTLFRELFNKTEQTYRITLAEPFMARAALEHHKGDQDAMTQALRGFVAEGMPAGKRRFELDQTGPSDR
ncbi:MAG: 1-acyl-sn-glycerol-3-phosphate acyltransferase [Pseudomonadota bacterium]